MNPRTLIRLSLVALFGLALLSFSLPGRAGEAPKKIRVLLVTGDDVMPAHNWFEVAQAIRETLLATEKFEVRICEDTGVLDAASSLDRYDLIFLHL